jgi:hypothetical protein
MADTLWMKNLANARFDGHDWQFKDVESVKKNLGDRYKLAIHNLYEETLEAIISYNSYADRTRHMSTLTIEELTSDSMAGFTILMSGSQIKVIRRSQGLDIISIGVRGFGSKQSLILQLFPCYDTFGSLIWQTMDQRSTLNNENIVKLAMKELVKLVDSNKGRS